MTVMLSGLENMVMVTLLRKLSSLETSESPLTCLSACFLTTGHCLALWIPSRQYCLVPRACPPLRTRAPSPSAASRISAVLQHLRIIVRPWAAPFRFPCLCVLICKITTTYLCIRVNMRIKWYSPHGVFSPEPSTAAHAC